MSKRISKPSSSKEPILNLLDIALKNDGIIPLELTQIIARKDRFLLGPSHIFETSTDVLYETQVSVLRDLGYLEEVIDLVPLPTQPTGLLVIPAVLVSLKLQMDVAGIDSSSADIYGDFDKKVLEMVPYWIYRLEIGVFSSSFTTKSIREILKSKKRRGLTFAEGINLYAQDPVSMLNMDGCLLFGAADENAPGLSVFRKSPNKIDVGPNNYHGEKGNGDHFISCAL